MLFEVAERALLQDSANEVQGLMSNLVQLMQNSKDAAEISYALMIGLRSAVYFDDDIDLPDAHRLFLSTMLAMCGFD